MLLFDRAAQAVELSDQVARLYHDPAIRKAAGDKLDWYWNHPREAYRALIDQSATHGLPPALDAALNVIGEARVFADELGVVDADPEIPPPPANARELEFEIGREFAADGVRIGGEAHSWTITPGGMSQSVIHRFADYEATAAGAELFNRIVVGAERVDVAAGLTQAAELRRTDDPAPAPASAGHL